jgi:hypothetical protein
VRTANVTIHKELTIKFHAHLMASSTFELTEKSDIPFPSLLSGFQQR